MGLFNRTEEMKRINALLNAIANGRTNPDTKKVLMDYVNQIKKGYPNDFEDLETLIRVMDKMIESAFTNEMDARNHWKQVIDSYHLLVHTDDPNYEALKNYFIEDFIGSDGCLYNGLFHEGMYATFANKKDYFEIMNRILQKDVLVERMDDIIDYIAKVGKYCMTQDILKRDVLAYIEGLKSVTEADVKKYGELELDRSKRRIGVYNISSEELATVDSKLRSVEGYLGEYENYKSSIEEEKRAISALVVNGKKEIQQATTGSIASIQKMITEQKQLLLQKLDEKILEVKESFKGECDTLFLQILDSYQERVDEFRRVFEGYSTTASKELIALQKETQQWMEKLQNYVKDEPHLQEMMKRIEEQNAVRQKMIRIVEKEEELREANPEGKVEVKPESTVEPVVIPGFDRVMVPYRRMILPEKIVTDINPLFDESIPFSKRKEELERRMEERERKGEIFHKKVKDIAVDLMEGDWPYLWGPSGTGKSYMIKQISTLLGTNLLKAGKITEPYSVLGYNDPQGRFCFTSTFVAALYGYLLSLDEFDNDNNDTQVVLNDIYSELLNKIADPTEVCEVLFGTDVPVDINPNFRMLSAGNTPGTGENEAFSSRGKIDESILQRMTPIYIDFDDKVEGKILEGHPAWLKFFTDFRKICVDYADSHNMSSPLGVTTTRDAEAIRKYIEHNSKTVDQVIAEKFVQIKDSEYRKALAREVANLYGVDYERVTNPSFNRPLAKADEKVLAKKFIYYCKEGVR